jgi:hypothetical protein
MLPEVEIIAHSDAKEIKAAGLDLIPMDNNIKSTSKDKVIDKLPIVEIPAVLNEARLAAVKDEFIPTRGGVTDSAEIINIQPKTVMDEKQVVPSVDKNKASELLKPSIVVASETKPVEISTPTRRDILQEERDFAFELERKPTKVDNGGVLPAVAIPSSGNREEIEEKLFPNGVFTDGSGRFPLVDKVITIESGSEYKMPDEITVTTVTPMLKNIIKKGKMHILAYRGTESSAFDSSALDVGGGIGRDIKVQRFQKEIKINGQPIKVSMDVVDTNKEFVQRYSDDYDLKYIDSHSTMGLGWRGDGENVPLNIGQYKNGVILPAQDAKEYTQEGILDPARFKLTELSDGRIKVKLVGPRFELVDNISSSLTIAESCLSGFHFKNALISASKGDDTFIMTKTLIDGEHLPGVLNNLLSGKSLGEIKDAMNAEEPAGQKGFVAYYSSPNKALQNTLQEEIAINNTSESRAGLAH